MRLRAVWGIVLGLGTALAVASEPDDPFMWGWAAIFGTVAAWLIVTGVRGRP